MTTVAAGRRITLGAMVMALCCIGVSLGCGDGATVRGPVDLEGVPVIYDFAKRLPAARVFEESTFLDLGTREASRNLRTGWGSDEARPDGTTYVWAVSRRAELDLLVFDTASTRFRFRAWPFNWDGSPDQTVTVRVNDREIGFTRLAPRARDYSFHVPRGVLVAGVNRVVLDFAFAEEARTRRPASKDHRTLAAAFDVVGIGDEPEWTGGASADRKAPTTGDDAVVLTPATGVVFAFNHSGVTTLSFGLGADGRPPPETAKVVVWSQRAGAASVELLATDLVRELGRHRAFRIDPGEGRLEVGFAVTGGGDPSSAGDWALRLTAPRLHAEERDGEKIGNVLMVVVDTLRADRLGVYGSRLATPNIDRLAARGVRFNLAFSHIPITGPSHASIFTSLIPAEHGVHNNSQVLGSDIPVMAEVLRDDGRNTASVISLGVLQGRFGLGRGFDIYLDEFRHDWMKNAAEVNSEVLDLLEGSLPEPFFLFVHYSDPHEPYAPPGIEYPRIALELNGEPLGELIAGGRGQGFDLELPPGDSQLRFVDAGLSKKRPFRLTTISVDDPDVEVQPTAGWETRERGAAMDAYQSSFPATIVLRSRAGDRRRVELELACKLVLGQSQLKRRYDLEVEYVDREIGRLLEFMERRHLLDNTLVVFLSDHGEGLGDHNHFGHISQLYNSLLRVPFIMAYPGRLPEGRVIDERVGLVDLAPTVMDLMGLESPPRANGVSLVPLMAGGEAEPRSIVAETYRPEAYSDKRALVRDGFKYIHSWTDDREWEELYDLSADPGELRDLSKIEVERLAAMRAALQNRLLKAVAADVVEADLSTAEIERLRALGYIH